MVFPDRKRSRKYVADNFISGTSITCIFSRALDPNSSKVESIALDPSGQVAPIK